MSPERETPPQGEPAGSGPTKSPGNAGVPSPHAHRTEVRDALERLLELAAGLQELPLDGVEPAFGPPRWA